MLIIAGLTPWLLTTGTCLGVGLDTEGAEVIDGAETDLFTLGAENEALGRLTEACGAENEAATGLAIGIGALAFDGLANTFLADPASLGVKIDGEAATDPKIDPKY